ncbi:hypothetical protein [Flavobacterium sp. GT3R68]|uniref:hypothetical protein n=1 Tax=Flavobacterium sp. GT3R68 TaxID=2594437 RepID=UPI000F8740DC|nr:hypothetical protein [Flavobacterium sp. GT3R68]RTY85535.1 hypothetical protein EKL32_28510 [Flavobacterium sp. GSN2]TRW89330.1 hypothetical protein FNW07_13575 [Flavobacterium sp. GT3R68]
MNRNIKIVIIIFSVLLVSVLSLRGKFTHTEFNSEKWKNANLSLEDLSLRWDMINSLRNNHELVGKSYEEINYIIV